MNKTSYLSSAIFTSATLLISLLIPTMAQAEDVKTTPGNACKQSDGTQVVDFQWGSPYIRNRANSYRRVACPIVRDNTTTTWGTAAFYTDVRLFNAGGTVSCYLVSSDAAGVLQNWDFQATAVGGLVTLQNDLNLSQVNGYYNLECTLPPNSRVNGYRIGEYTSTDSNN